MPPRASRAVATVVLAAVLALAACAHGSGSDAVTVTAGSTTVTLPSALSCSAPTGATRMTCAERSSAGGTSASGGTAGDNRGGESADAAPHLAIAPGTPLDVEVPKQVSEAPWVIVFSYRGPDGASHGDRTKVFAPGKSSSYRLVPPKGAQLTRLEVQTLTAAPASGGGVDFPATGTWVLLVDPVGGAPSRSPAP